MNDTPEHIGDYAVMATIGSGAFGVVYRAQHKVRLQLRTAHRSVLLQ